MKYLFLFIIVPAAITFLAQSGGTFGGLGVLAASLYFLAAFCALCGYGAAWLIYLITRGWGK